MKTALLLYGHVRTFEQTKENMITSIINRFQPDVYVHTWDTYGYSTNGHPDSHIPNEFSSLHNIEPKWDSGKIDMGLFNDLNIKHIVVEKEQDVMPKIRIKAREFMACKQEIEYPPNTLSILRKWFLVNLLKKQHEIDIGVNYDLVIRTRMDCVYDDPSIFLNDNPNILHIPNGHRYEMAFLDWVCWGSSSIMDELADMNDYSTTFCKEFNINTNVHTYLEHYINFKKIPFASSEMSLRLLKTWDQ